MDNIWVLTIKTSLPNTCCSYNDLKATVLAFDSYEKARAAFREKLKTLAFSQNTMFNASGQIVALNRFISKSAISVEELGDIDETENKYLSKERLMQLQVDLIHAFSGNDTKICLADDYYTNDCDLSMQVKSNSVHLYGAHEGFFNSVAPIIHTNIFSMAEEKDYFLYIDDMFGQDSNSSELYMDLTKVSLN